MSYTPPSNDAIDYVRRKVAAGFHESREDLEEAIDGAFYDDEASATAAYEALPAELAARERAMKDWPAVTDCDKLDAAFARLEASGIIARQDFTCCNTCGHYEIRDLLRDATKADRDVRGYVFFHMQDTDRVVAGEPLALRYGSPDRDEQSDLVVGRAIADALRAEGIETSWDEDPTRVITVPSLRWQRRSAPRVWAPPFDELVERVASVLPGLVRARFVDMGALLGSLYVLQGHVERAFAFAAAPSGSRPARLSSAVAFAAVAKACGTRADATRASEAWVRAFELVPETAPETLLSLMTNASLDAPRVLEAAQKRALATERDLWGAAIVAMLALRSEALPREERVDIAGRAAELFERKQPKSEYSNENAAQRALASALIALEAKGILEKAPGGAREKASETSYPSTFASEPAPATKLARRALDAMNRGAPSDDPELRSDLADARAALDELATLEMEGLVDGNEAAETRANVMVLAAFVGERNETQTNIHAIDTAARVEPPELADTKARLAAIADGAPPALATMSKTPPSDAAFQRALDKWSAATTKSERFRARRFGAVILERAQALAAAGERTAASLLLDSLVSREKPELALDYVFSRAPMLLTLTAVGRAEDAAAIARESLAMLEDEQCAFAITLASMGDREAAIARVRAAMNKALELRDLPLLAPALAAVSDDPRATAKRLLDIVSKGAAAIDSVVKP
jgi:hypothetical protein